MQLIVGLSSLKIQLVYMLVVFRRLYEYIPKPYRPQVKFAPQHGIPSYTLSTMVYTLCTQCSTVQLLQFSC